MKVLVPVKRVIDYNVRVRVATDGSGIDLSNTKMSMNPFDEIALEQAIRLKEAGLAEEVVAVSIGPTQCQEILRTALAMGADRGILVEITDPAQGDVEPLSVAKLLKAVVVREDASLIICGKQAIDNDMNATGQMLAAFLGWGQATFASHCTLEGDSIVVAREVDFGAQTIRVKMPAVVTVDLRLNEPRYASLPNIMKAKKKPMTVIPISELGIDISPRHTVINTVAPEARKPGVMVASVDELVSKIKEAGAVQ